MRTRVRVTDLSKRQWQWLQGNLLVEYRFQPFEPRACAEFEIGIQGCVAVRHVEMPLPTFVGLAVVLQSIGDAEEMENERRTAPLAEPVLTRLPVLPTAEPVLTRLPVLPTAEQVRNLSATEAAQLAADMNRQVRKDCAFCGLERTAKDDNHAPDCAYWRVGPGSLGDQ